MEKEIEKQLDKYLEYPRRLIEIVESQLTDYNGDKFFPENCETYDYCPQRGDNDSTLIVPSNLVVKGKRAFVELKASMFFN